MTPTISLAVLALAAPVPKGDPLYHPVTVGHSRTYDDGGTWDEIVTKVEKDKDGGLVVTVAHSDRGTVTSFRTVRVARDGVWVVAGVDGKPVDPPNPFLKLGLAAGESWGHRTAHGVEYRYTCRGVERVTVPAGSFDAVRVDCEVVAAPGLPAARGTVAASWYAPGLGEVRNEILAGQGGGPRPQGRRARPVAGRGCGRAGSIAAADGLTEVGGRC